MRINCKSWILKATINCQLELNVWGWYS
jgi:hypothetical protein